MPWLHWNDWNPQGLNVHESSSVCWLRWLVMVLHVSVVCVLVGRGGGGGAGI